MEKGYPFQQTILEQLLIQIQKKTQNWNVPFTMYKNDLDLDCLNVKSKTIKPLEGNIGENFCDLGKGISGHKKKNL